jgi:hypothetical protein
LLEPLQGAGQHLFRDIADPIDLAEAQDTRGERLQCQQAPLRRRSDAIR